MATAPIEDENLDAAERRRVIDGAIANLKAYYVDPDVAQKTSDALLAHERNGDDNAATDGAAFADLLTTQMMDVSHDKYLVIEYSEYGAATARENPTAPTTEEVARYRKEMEQTRCTIEAAQILPHKTLPHKIGYLKLNEFPDAAVCGTTVATAMASLNRADAIIFDLRDNRGGYSNMVALIATYLFDRPTHLNDFYNRGDNSTEQSWTLPPVPENRLADKPVFVLISPVTFSAAEAFSYDLKMLNRATLVGETTSGRGDRLQGRRGPCDGYRVARFDATPQYGSSGIRRTHHDGSGGRQSRQPRGGAAYISQDRAALVDLRKVPKPQPRPLDYLLAPFPSSRRSKAAVSHALVGSDDSLPQSLKSTQSFVMETAATLRYREGRLVFSQFRRLTKNMEEGQWPDFL